MPSAVQLDYLSRWLLERELEQKMGETPMPGEEAEDTDLDLASFPDLLRSYDATIQPGQIRLFAPAAHSGLDGLLYFSVLKDWEENEWLIAPFSRYSSPVLPGELLLQREDTHLQTLCLWNARTMQKEQVEKSWIDSSLGTKELEESLAVFRSQLTGHELPDALKERIGSHIVRPDDPRIEYQNEEVLRLDRFQNPLASTSESKLVYLPSWFEDIELPLAADDGESIHSKCVVLPMDLLDEPVEKTTIKQTDFEANHCGGEYHIHGQWWIETARKLSAGFVFLDGTLLQEVSVAPEGDGIWIDLRDAVLPDSHSIMENAANLELVLLEGT
jgi:hypothetical protein